MQVRVGVVAPSFRRSSHGPVHRHLDSIEWSTADSMWSTASAPYAVHHGRPSCSSGS